LTTLPIALDFILQVRKSYLYSMQIISKIEKENELYQIDSRSLINYTEDKL